jgi:hypothetical protein
MPQNKLGMQCLTPRFFDDRHHAGYKHQTERQRGTKSHKAAVLRWSRSIKYIAKRLAHAKNAKRSLSVASLFNTKIKSPGCVTQCGARPGEEELDEWLY